MVCYLPKPPCGKWLSFTLILESSSSWPSMKGYRLLDSSKVLLFPYKWEYLEVHLYTSGRLVPNVSIKLTIFILYCTFPVTISFSFTDRFLMTPISGGIDYLCSQNIAQVPQSFLLSMACLMGAWLVSKNRINGRD